MEKVDATGGVSKFLFYRGLEAKKAGMKKGYNYHWFYDRFVFSRVLESVGLDKTVLTISGSAPLSTVVLDFLRCVIGNVVVEGYGATETAGATLLQLPDDYTSGNVGGPLACCDMRLEDIPDMSYLHTDREHNGLPCIGRGELCLRVGSLEESQPGFQHLPRLLPSSRADQGGVRRRRILPHGRYRDGVPERCDEGRSARGD